MKRTFSRLVVAALLSGMASSVGAQAPAPAKQTPAAAPAATPAPSANEEQITKLEAELSKLRDTSPEAADVMLKLVDLYAAEGYVAMAPDLFWRLEKNVDLGYGDADFKHAFDLYGRFDVARGVRDIAAAVKALGKEMGKIWTGG